MPWASRFLKLTCLGAWWLVTQLNTCRTLGVGLLGNVLTQEGFPRGGGIIRNLTKVFSKSPHCPGVGGGGVEVGFSLTHALQWPIYLKFYISRLHRSSTTVSLETNPLVCYKKVLSKE